MGQEEKTQVLKASCLTLEIKEFLCYEAKIEKVKRLAVAGSNPGQLSGRALVAQARGVLGSTPVDCWPFHFPLFLPHDI